MLSPRTCEVCQANIKPTHEGTERWKRRRFCSFACLGLARSLRKTFRCQQCGCEFIAKPSRVRGNRAFCSRRCYSDSCWKGGWATFMKYRPRSMLQRAARPPLSATERRARKSHLNQIRRFRQKGASGSHSFQEWLERQREQRYRCALCGLAKPLTRDHIIPITKGGTNHIGNIIGLCRNCNSRKGTRLIPALFVWLKPLLLSA